MNIEHLEQNIRDLVSDVDPETFVYDLLRAYDLPKASITRLQKGDYNQSKKDGELLWKKKLCFRHESDGDLHGCIDRLKTDTTVVRHAPRFIVVTDFETILAVDTKTDDTIDTPIVELADHFDFFLPWAGMEKSQLQSENPADIKAAEKMGRLYELILADNPADTEGARHALNIFLSRLLFCFFAEDTDIFVSNQFTNGVASHTATDGSDLQGYLQKLFAVLSTEDRQSLPEYLRNFPYVNGGLFGEEYPVPVFNTKSRALIIECGSLNWKAINPDIFGSMIQAVVHTEQRGKMGMHYTSVVNILKVIEPLFLSELRKQLEQAGSNTKKLQALLDRLYQLRIFDPACGSGNFLIIAYKELCRLEIDAFRRLYKDQQGTQTSFRFQSSIELTQFYGIELDDFAHETAKLSLWLAEHQMNLEFKQVFGTTRPTLPLQDGGHIVCGNATRLDWENVCPKEGGVEVFVLGNPPYLGARNQSKEQKADLAHVFENHKDFKDSDYVCCWFLKGINYLGTGGAEFAFVATNSICQGEQVSYLWPRILENAEIGFAHKSFKWTNQAKGNAGVTCVILGIRRVSDKEKTLFENDSKRIVHNISPYLHDGRNVIVFPAPKPLKPVPKIVMGNMPRDGGHLILSEQEYTDLRTELSKNSEILRRYFGANELLNGQRRYCLWIEDANLSEANAAPKIAARIDAVKKFREDSKAKTTNQYATIPHKFAQRSYISGSKVIVPSVSSERREYVPFGFLDSDSIISNLAYAIYNVEPFLFGIISSKLHMTWIQAIAGRLESRIRYTASLCYNTFPFPDISDKQKTEIERHAFNVLEQREAFPERTLAELYDPNKMPPTLREAHHELDLVVERCYRKKPFDNDEERLEYLFRLYEKMIKDEENADA